MEMITMYDYYCSQPECMKHILERRKELFSRFGSFYAEKKPDRVYLVGSGSSMNACLASSDFISRVLDTDVFVVPPSKPVTIRGKRPLVIAVSQEGRSSNTVAFLEKLREKDCRIASFTAALGVPVASAADVAVEVAVGAEKVGPKTRGYTGTVLSLYLAALAAGLEGGSVTRDEHGRYLSLLEETIGYAEENLASCEAFYKEHLADLRRIRHYLFVGKGVAAAVGAEDTIKVLETLCYPSAGYEFEEYLHGPACCTDEGTGLFLFYSKDADGPRMEKLAAITAKASRNSYIIDRTSTLRGDHVLRLKAGDDAFMSPFVDIFFGQLISALLTGELGRTRHEAVKEIFSDMNTKVKP